MILLVLLSLLVGGTLIFGRRFLGDVWRLLSHGAPRVLDEVVANGLFQIFGGAIAVAVGLPIVGGLVGLFLAHRHYVLWIFPTGPDVGRVVIFFSFLLSFIILWGIWRLADIFARVLEFFDPDRNIENMRTGIRRWSLTGLSVELLIAGALLTIGVFAPMGAIGVVLLGVLLYWVASEALGRETRLLLRAAVAFAILFVLYGGIASVPPSWWLALTGKDLSPIVRFHSAVDNIDVDEAEHSRFQRERELCSEEIQRLENFLGAAGAPDVGNFSARLEEVRRYSRELETVKRACSERTRVMDLR